MSPISDATFTTRSRANSVSQYGMIAHEALNIQGIARSRLAKSTHDVGWGQFLSILHSKAEGAGVQVIAVPPANTTQQCSACGALPETPGQRKRLGDRVHRCPSCGYMADRDLNAAQNMLRLGRSLQALTWGVRALPEKPLSLGSGVVTPSPSPPGLYKFLQNALRLSLP